MKYYEGMTGEFTTKGRVERVTPNAAHDEDLVEIQLQGGVYVALMASSMDKWFEMDEPEYEAGAVYEDANGDFWTLDIDQYTGDSRNAWLAFGVGHSFHFDTPRRPLKLHR